MQISYFGICTCTSSHPVKEGLICCLFDVMQEFSGDEADNQIDMIDRGEPNMQFSPMIIEIYKNIYFNVSQPSNFKP